MIGDHCADDELQAKIGNVKPEPEPVGRHPRFEDARGIDRFESRYVHRHEICSLQFFASRCSLHLHRYWSAINGRLR